MGGGEKKTRALVRVQLIRSDEEGEYVARSFDYEVSPTTESYQEPLFMRAEGFYKQIQEILTRVGKVTITGQESLKP